ncbi:MerR family DNA-binding transcriptional regulator [Cyanobium sp. Tous-M-B4]|nr:MerR family DNA-binding transcriptional regulator [Cyanobium sp. Tous-M-B4]MCP9876369.1 MerR family DNA-binding transcriptional regulator [Cyanobium sp. A2C-AMD]
MGRELAVFLRWGLLLLESQVAALQPPEVPAQKLQKIGAVAARLGVSVKTIRFYCDQGLLQPSGRSEGHYRLFDKSVDSDLALIRTLRGLELPLPTIKAVLEARRSGMCTCDNLQATIRGKAGEIEQRIVDLQSLHAELNGLLSTWQSCGGRPAQVSAGS